MTEWPDIRATYDAVAKEYAAAFAGELAAKPFDRELLADFAAACDGLVFDVGCGAAGHVTRFLADQGADVVGVDLSAASIEVARARQPALRFEVADMRNLPAADGLAGGTCRVLLGYPPATPSTCQWRWRSSAGYCRQAACWCSACTAAAARCRATTGSAGQCRFAPACGRWRS